jgi:hypothetical protein
VPDLPNGILADATETVPLARAYAIDNMRRLVMVHSQHPLEMTPRQVAIPWSLIKFWAGSIIVAEAQTEMQASGMAPAAETGPKLVGH